MRHRQSSLYMLTSKCLGIVEAVLLYALQVRVIMCFLELADSDREDKTSSLVVIVIIGALILAVSISRLVLAIMAAVRKEAPVAGLSILIKVIVIPFFLLNLFLWGILCAGMFNPFLMVIIPVIAGVGMAVTYIIMLTFSLPDVVYTIITYSKNKDKLDRLALTGIILSFFFVADIIGTLLIFLSFRQKATSPDHVKGKTFANYLSNDQKLPMMGIGPYMMTLVAVISLGYLAVKYACMDLEPVVPFIPYGVILSATGLVLMFAGLFVWYTGAYLTGIDDGIINNELVTDGIYSYTRNPIYTGIWMMVAGVTMLLTGDLISVAVMILQWGTMTIVLKVTEEKWLESLYGKEYILYKERVNRFIPVRRRVAKDNR